MKEVKQKKNDQLRIRLSIAEHDMLRKQAKKLGITVSEYVRRAATALAA